MPTLTTVIQHSMEDLATAIRKAKKIKCIQIRRVEVKLSLYADDMILYIENPKDSTLKLLKLINGIQQTSRIQNNTQKMVAFLKSNSEILEKEFKNTIPF